MLGRKNVYRLGVVLVAGGAYLLAPPPHANVDVDGCDQPEGCTITVDTLEPAASYDIFAVDRVWLTTPGCSCSTDEEDVPQLAIVDVDASAVVTTGSHHSYSSFRETGARLGTFLAIQDTHVIRVVAEGRHDGPTTLLVLPSNSQNVTYLMFRSVSNALGIVGFLLLLSFVRTDDRGDDD